MFKYADLYMQYKPKWTRAVVLNIYGGESLLHPDIVEILEQVRKKYECYKNKWPLKITCTTNATLSEKNFSKVAEYIDEFTFSYHCETHAKNKKRYKNNALFCKQHNIDIKCIVLMHSNYDYWEELFDFMDFCQENNINYLPRQLDGVMNSHYNQEQIEWFKNYYISKTHRHSKIKQQELLTKESLCSENNLASVGRACCGGRSLCTNANLKQSVYYLTDNHFRDWYCSVNWFFLAVRQFSGNIYTNKDCKMSFNGTQEPIGHISNSEQLLTLTKKYLKTGSMPTIQCKKEKCYCGLCAPKALTKESLHAIMDKHITQDVFEKDN